MKLNFNGSALVLRLNKQVSIKIKDSILKVILVGLIADFSLRLCFLSSASANSRNDPRAESTEIELDVDSLKVQLELFESEVAAGLRLDLEDQDQRDLLHHYLYSKLLGWSTQTRAVARITDIVRDQYRNTEIPDKVILPGKIIAQTNFNREFLVRNFSLMECPYRGLWGGDCSSLTRPTRALQSGHLSFAIEMAGLAFGQVEVIVGRTSTGPVSFLERVQIPRKVSVVEIAMILLAVREIVEVAGIPLVVPKGYYSDSEFYNNLGHDLGNINPFLIYQSLVEFFEHGETVPGFVVVPDVFRPNTHENYVNIARRVEHLKFELVFVRPKLDRFPQVGLNLFPRLVLSGHRYAFSDLASYVKSLDKYDGNPCAFLW